MLKFCPVVWGGLNSFCRHFFQVRAFWNGEHVRHVVCADVYREKGVYCPKGIRANIKTKG